MVFEEEFGSEISDSDQKILTVGDAIKFIESKVINFNVLKKRGDDSSFIPSGAGKTTLVKLISKIKTYLNITYDKTP